MNENHLKAIEERNETALSLCSNLQDPSVETISLLDIEALLSEVRHLQCSLRDVKHRLAAVSDYIDSTTGEQI